MRSLPEELGRLFLVGIALGHGQGQVHEAILVRLNLYAVQGEEDDGGGMRPCVCCRRRTGGSA